MNSCSAGFLIQLLAFLPVRSLSGVPCDPFRYAVDQKLCSVLVMKSFWRFSFSVTK